MYLSLYIYIICFICIIYIVYIIYLSIYKIYTCCPTRLVASRFCRPTSAEAPPPEDIYIYIYIYIYIHNTYIYIYTHIYIYIYIIRMASGEGSHAREARSANVHREDKRLGPVCLLRSLYGVVRITSKVKIATRSQLHSRNPFGSPPLDSPPNAGRMAWDIAFDHTWAQRIEKEDGTAPAARQSARQPMQP